MKIPVWIKALIITIAVLVVMLAVWHLLLFLWEYDQQLYWGIAKSSLVFAFLLLFFWGIFVSLSE